MTGDTTPWLLLGAALAVLLLGVLVGTTLGALARRRDRAALDATLSASREAAAAQEAQVAQLRAEVAEVRRGVGAPTALAVPGTERSGRTGRRSQRAQRAQVEQQEYVITRLGDGTGVRPAGTTTGPTSTTGTTSPTGTALDGVDDGVLGGRRVEVAGRIDGRLFADLVVRETLVRIGSVAHGVRCALDPATRNRIRFEVRREVKRSRKARKADLKQARRDLHARQRASQGVGTVGSVGTVPGAAVPSGVEEGVA